MASLISPSPPIPHPRLRLGDVFDAVDAGAARGESTESVLARLAGAALQEKWDAETAAGLRLLLEWHPGRTELGGHNAPGEVAHA